MNKVKYFNLYGSTGQIGSKSLQIIDRYFPSIKINLLVANTNYKKLLKQAISYKPKFISINDGSKIKHLKKNINNKETKIIHSSELFHLIKSSKSDISILAISGYKSLEYLTSIFHNTNTLGIVNKECIVSAGHLFHKINKTNKTKIFPLDSEHYSLKNFISICNYDEFKKIYITASGGPFLKKSLKDFKNIKPKEAIKHPNWQMGKKISIDSSNMMNKVLEVIEAFKLFPFNPDKYKIIIHPQSLVHAIVFFKNGQTKFLYHETDMLIPIANAIYENKIDIETLSGKKNSFPKNCQSLKFQEIDKKKFPIVTFLSKNILQNSAPIILNASNEVLVDSFIKGKITFNSIYLYLRAVFRDKDFGKYAIKKAPNVKEIYRIDKWARRKTIEKINEKKNI